MIAYQAVIDFLFEQKEPLRRVEIAELLNCKTSELTDHLKRLVREGFVQKIEGKYKWVS